MLATESGGSCQGKSENRIALGMVGVRLETGLAHVARLIGLRRARQLTGFTVRDRGARFALASILIIILAGVARFIADVSGN